MTRVQLSLLAPGGSRLVAKTRRCQRRERGFESRLPLQVMRRCSQDSKASACKAENRECNSPHRLQIGTKKFCAGVAQREEQAHGKRPTAVRGCVPAPQVCCCGRHTKAPAL